MTTKKAPKSPKATATPTARERTKPAKAHESLESAEDIVRAADADTAEERTRHMRAYDPEGDSDATTRQMRGADADTADERTREMREARAPHATGDIERDAPRHAGDDGNLDAIHTPKASDRKNLPDDDRAMNTGENWLEALEQRSAEGGPLPEHEIDLEDDETNGRRDR